MQIKLFTMPAFGGEKAEEELNKFLRSHRVLQLERHFISEQGGYWAFMVEFADGDPVAEAPPQGRNVRSKDPTAGMDDEVKMRFNVYRDVRKRLASERGIPSYLVFTNEELTALAQLPVLDQESVKGLKGIAPQRMKDYIQFFFNLIPETANHDETSRQPDAANLQSAEPA